MVVSRVVFYAGALATHAFLGYALVRAFTDADPWLGLGFGLLPDADFFFPAALEWPFVHRGLTHSPLVWLALVLAAVAARDRSVASAVGLAYGSHLLLDSLSPKGIEWLFPLQSDWSPGLPIHTVYDTPLLWTGCLALLAWRTTALDPYLPSELRTGTGSDS
ncbi:metal-dependent hydrolase [Halovivax limisalsi]|uniref:metal-dependent hydrolase n=1 Tax=Halovivax limisalsi TaxID=1453760 RepID=UPI001FFCA0AA|nr:metal-dependent hydrolase [Halovivax limisalsi]